MASLLVRGSVLVHRNLYVSINRLRVLRRRSLDILWLGLETRKSGRPATFVLPHSVHLEDADV